MPLGDQGQFANMPLSAARVLHAWLSETLKSVDAVPKPTRPRQRKRSKKPS